MRHPEAEHSPAGHSAAGHPLDRPGLAPLWRAFHDRLSTGQPVARVRVGPLDEAAQNAVADLLGLDRLPGPRPTLSLTRLDQALRDSCGEDTRSVVTAIVGPVGDRAAARATDRADRAALWEWLATHPVVLAQPALDAWVAQVRRAGLTGGSVATTRSTLADALRTLSALPARGEPLPVFATRILNDSHALDDGTRLSGLVLRALAALYDTAAPESASERRALWARAGIADDALSTTVLTAGLRPTGDGPVAHAVTAYSRAGHATHLTLAQLRTPGELRFPPTVVHITENPSIPALALQRFGPACPPLVCTSGWPNSAVLLLLRHLAEAGAPLRHHGDFDGEGLRIAAHVLAKTPATPWRMSASDYLTARARTDPGPPVGRITEAPWDPALSEALLTHRTAVLEEHVAEDLLADLSRHPATRNGPTA
ncbi:TIGR02679 family protein [Streptomyces enissocaesilis]|uniref:TIGR02679 family protein n=1 Tax=Streptomyces enissocaesilis TaxID=332589 RepID=A0ABN3XM96_9ACTN